MNEQAMQKPILYTFTFLLVLSSCTGSYKLARHNLDGKTVFITSNIPEAPFADFDMTIYDKVGNEVPVFQRKPEPTSSGIPHIAVHAPSADEIIEEEEKTDTHVLIDSVLAVRSMSNQLLRFTEALSTQQFGFDPVDTEEQADYNLDLEIHDYGIGADSWTTTVFFEISATITLIDQQTQKRIWQEEVHDLVTVSKAILQAGMPQDKTQSPASLADKSYEEIDDLLTALAKYGADQLTLPLREAYRHSVDREKAELIENEVTAANP